MLHSRAVRPASPAGHGRKWLAVLVAALLFTLPAPAFAAPAPQVLPQDFGASASVLATAGSISAGSNVLNIVTPLDFKDDEGISVVNAGRLPQISAPAGLSVSPGIDDGATCYSYAVAALDGRGGVTAACTASTWGGAYTLSPTSPNLLEAAATPDAVGYAWWRTATRGAPYTTGFIGISEGGRTFRDTGLPVITPPPGIPATPPTTACGDLLVTAISSGGGTNSLILAAPAVNSVQGSPVSHDDTAAIRQAIDASSAVYFAPGTYPISSTIAVPSGKKIYGAGRKSLIVAQWPLSSGNHWWYNSVMFHLDDGTQLTNVTIDGLAFDGERQLPALDGASAIDVAGSFGADGITVQNCFFSNNYRAITTDTPLGGYYSYNNILIKNNAIVDITGMALQLRGVNHLTVDGNTLSNTGDNSSGKHWDALYVQGGSDIVITNNRIGDSTDNTIEVGSYDNTGSARHVPDNVLIDNNVLENAYDHDILIDPAVNAVIRDNDLENSNENSILARDGGLNSSDKTEVPSQIKISGNFINGCTLGSAIDFEVGSTYIGPTNGISITDNNIQNVRWSAVTFNIRSTGNIPGQTVVDGNRAEHVFDLLENKTQYGIIVSNNGITNSVDRPILTRFSPSELYNNILYGSDGGEHLILASETTM